MNAQEPHSSTHSHADSTSIMGAGVHGFDTGPFNWYLLEERGRFTLIDAGFPGHVRVLERGLRDLAVDTSSIEAIVLTHAHADHTGFADVLARRLGIAVYVHADEAAKATRRLQLPWATLLGNAWRPWGSALLGRAIGSGIMDCTRVPDPTPVQDGDSLDVPGTPRVVHTPGHTPGHMSLVVEQRSVLFSGDALLTRSLRTGRVAPPSVASRGFNMDERSASRSAERLLGYEGFTVYPGHGEPAVIGTAPHE